MVSDMEVFVVLLLISLLYAVVAAYKWKGVVRDSQIVGAFLVQICFCYFMAFRTTANDLIGNILAWHFGCFLSIILGGSIGAIVGEHIETDGKRTVSYWFHLAFANCILALIGVLFLFFSL